MMDSLVQKITDFCLDRNIIDADNASWFKYGIAKRLSTIFVSIPLFMVAATLTSIEVSIAYFLSFAVIRRRANGYHAKSWLNCLFLSIAIVSVFLGLIYPILTPSNSFWVSVACIFLVFVFAPYDHKLMHFTPEEYSACRRYSRISICITAFLALLLYLVGLDSIAAAVVTGMVTAVFLLCLGHISDWRNKHGEKESPG